MRGRARRAGLSLVARPATGRSALAVARSCTTRERTARGPALAGGVPSEQGRLVLFDEFGLRGRLAPQVRVGEGRRDAASRRAGEEALLNEEGLVHVHDRILVLARGRGDRV